MMELALPITVYWDLSPAAPSHDLLPRFCSEILECRPLMLQLFDPSPVLSEAALTILEQFRGASVAVSLTLPSASLLSLAGGELGVKELLIACDSPVYFENIPGLPEAGIAFFVNRNNWRELPEAVSFCRNRGINRLVLPMQRLYGGEKPFLLTRSEQEELSLTFQEIGGIGGLRLTIHDPFLWRAFNPGIPFPQGGCQAANTMIAISPDGGVYPCPTLPERLGVLGGEISLKDMLCSPAKKELRSRIIGTPTACSSCHDLAVCKGGCRGRSLVINSSFDGIDDACR